MPNTQNPKTVQYKLIWDKRDGSRTQKFFHPDPSDKLLMEELFIDLILDDEIHTIQTIAIKEDLTEKHINLRQFIIIFLRTLTARGGDKSRSRKYADGLIVALEQSAWKCLV